MKTLLEGLSEDSLYALQTAVRRQIRKLAKGGGSPMEIQKLRDFLAALDMAQNERIDAILAGNS